MLVDDLEARAAFLSKAEVRAGLINDALLAADWLYAALHEALQDGSSASYAALRTAEQAWVSARQAVDNGKPTVRS